MRKQRKTKFHLTLLVLLLATGAIVISPTGREGLLLLGILILAVLIGVYFNTIASLSVTLLVYFLIGSVLFWSYLTVSKITTVDINFITLLIWAILLLLLSLSSGRIANLLASMTNENKSLTEQLNTLVVIDPETGFDNKKRMFVELELEFSRSKRYKLPYSLIVMRLENVDQFQQLYGEMEYERLLKHISRNMYRTTRQSDQRFRIDQSHFALLLSNTDVENASVVVEKLKEELSTFQLMNKRYVTIGLRFGCAGFEEDQESYLDLYNDALSQVTIHES